MLNRLCTYAWLATIASASASSGAAAQQPSTVTVSVELALPKYRRQFGDRKAVERKAAAVFAEYLAKNVGFLRFAADDSTRPYRLAFILDRIDRQATGGFPEIGFWVHLDRPDDDAKELYWLQFRTPDQALSGVGDEVAFLTEIKSKLAHRDADSLRSGVLRWIPIGETGLPTLNPLGFVMPFRLLELCMKRQSMVELLAELSGPVTREVPFTARLTGSFTPSGTPTPDVESFRGGGFADVVDLPQPNDLSPSIARHAVKVKKIFVIAYVHDPTACANRAPMPVGGGVP